MLARAATMTAGAMALAAAAQATILFDNFGPGDTYDFGVGWTVGSASDWQLGPGFVMSAGGDYFLDAVTASLRHIDGPNAVTLSVYDTVGGLPGNLLETSAAAGLPAHDGTPAPPTVFTFSGSTVLQDGETYWVVASTDGPGGSWLAWNWNINHTLGLHGQRQGEGPWQVFNFEQGVMRVEGTLVPAPAVLALFGLAAATARRRRR